MARNFRLHASSPVSARLGALLAQVEDKPILLCGWKTLSSELLGLLRLSRPYGILQRTTIMDAVRTSDKRVVVLKQVPKSRYPIEEELNRFLTMSEPQASDRHNYSVPVYKILQSPLDENVLILVMPYLARIYSVKFATVGEAVECFRQLFEVSMVFVSP